MKDLHSNGPEKTMIDLSLPKTTPQPTPIAHKAPRKRLKLKAPKGALSVFALLFLCLFTAESTAWVSYWILTGHPMSYAVSTTEQEMITKNAQLVDMNGLSGKGTGEMTNMLVHPYLGYIRPQGDPNAVPGQDYLLGKKPLITEPSEDTLVVGIFGGSFAEQFSDQGSAILKALLTEQPQFAGKNVEIFTAAVAGYKQPQQLLSLNYLLSMGQHFDMIVNIDGFNEVAGPAIENIPRNVNPDYPTGWYHLADRLPNMQVLSGIGEVAYKKQQRKKLSQWMLSSPVLSRSSVAQFLWKGLDGRAVTEIAASQLALKQIPATDEHNQELLGLEYSFDNEEELLGDLVGQWERSSLLMHELASAHDIAYVHLIQPNQYVAGSKRLSSDEQSIALGKDNPYERWVVKGFPILREAGRRLASKGVLMEDFTHVFANVTETVYKDDCCHINQFGNNIIGAAVAKVIQQSITSEAFAVYP